MEKAEIEDLIVSAAEGKPADFKAAFNDLMADKISAAIEARKQEVAAAYFSDSEDTEEINTEDENAEDPETNA